MNISKKSIPPLIVFFIAVLMFFIPNSSLSAAAAEASLDPVVALANNTPVHKSELHAVLEQYKKKTHKTTVTETEKLELLNSLIRRKLILSQNEITAIRQTPFIQQRVKAFEDQMVLNYYLNKKIGDKLNFSDEEMESYYWSHIDKFIAPPKVNASHILLRSQEDAQMVLNKLKNGDSFTELAKKYSIDLPMALEGGSMGTIEKGKSLPQLEEALFILDVGEISDIIKSRYGYHILRVDKIIADKHYPFKEVREKIKAELTKEKEAIAFQEMVGQLEEGKVIEIYKDRL